MASTTTKITHPDGTVLECTTTSAVGASPCTGSAVVYGMSVSGNVIPPVLIAMDTGCGKEDLCDIMKGQQNTPEFLAINPWHQIPMMKDGDFCLGESNAISRYFANKYAPELYGSTPEEKATTDWAMDWASTNFYKSYAELWYPVAGFGPAPEDFPAACTKAVGNLDTFCAKFLAGGNKFVGGSQLSIADYKVATWLWYLDHPAVKAITGFELPARCKTYVTDFLGASANARSYLEGVPKGFMDSKLA